jgi:hypothetical protein
MKAPFLFNLDPSRPLWLLTRIELKHSCPRDRVLEDRKGENAITRVGHYPVVSLRAGRLASGFSPQIALTAFESVFRNSFRVALYEQESIVGLK